MTIEELKVKLNSQGGSLSGIYLIREKLTGEPYVGKAKFITNRIIQHINNKKAKSGIDKKLAELGIDAFDFEILDLLPGADDNLLFFKEQEWIAKLDAKKNGSNLTQGNVNHTKKWLATIEKYMASHTVSADMMKLIAKYNPNFFSHSQYTLIHEYDEAFKNRLKFDGCKIRQIQSIFTTQNSRGELKEDDKELADYINKELDTMKLSNQTYLGESINNVPYGSIGATIMSRIVKEFDFDDCYSLEPGNDYFTKEKLYKHIDPSFKPIICRNGCFKDASQTTVITKLQKAENSLSEIEARIMLHIDAQGNDKLETAIKEYLLKVKAAGTLAFRQRDDIRYTDDTFVFNPGAFDIHHGYFAVYDSKKKDYTSSTKYNLLKQDTTGHKNSPSSAVKGCKQFKKIIYSKLGLQILEVLFTASPEGWGFIDGMFADIDYSDCKTIIDVFNKLGLSAESQAALIAAASEVIINPDELKVCQLAEAF